MGGFLFGLFTLGMMDPAQVNMILLYSLIYDLNLPNTLSGLMIVNISVTLPVAVSILTGFMKTIPKELFEACTIDGANNWQVYRRIALPLSLPSLSATAILLFVMHWKIYCIHFCLLQNMSTKPYRLLY
ncbi:ABC transporter permease subunit [Halobacillus mangrovi]|uniref:ABC transporter permease subunit n=1 Tax=Halobacillus mangrovi TaxID=402384 RepID=UPI003D96C5A9